MTTESNNKNIETAQEIINQQWFVAGALIQDDNIKIQIMAGSPDPEIGAPVMYTREFFYSSNNIAQAENLVRYVVELHNRNLANGTISD